MKKFTPVKILTWYRSNFKETRLIANLILLNRIYSPFHSHVYLQNLFTWPKSKTGNVKHFSRTFVYIFVNNNLCTVFICWYIKICPYYLSHILRRFLINTWDCWKLNAFRVNRICVYTFNINLASPATCLYFRTKITLLQLFMPYWLHQDIWNQKYILIILQFYYLTF